MKTMRNLFGRAKNRKGQTALEYALVIAVVATLIIGAATAIFRDEEKGAKKVFTDTIGSVSKTIEANN